ncbi:hypothetical protein ACFE04_006528 [Oxalis oulophora]
MLPCARNAWQRLGNMSPELAMEQYISVLSEKDPSWMEEHSVGDSKQEHSDSGMCSSKDPSTTLVAQYSPSANEHTTEMKPNSEGAEVTSGSSVENQACYILKVLPKAKKMKTLLDPRHPESLCNWLIGKD